MDEIDSFELSYLRSVASAKEGSENTGDLSLICECNCISLEDIKNFHCDDDQDLIVSLKQQLGLGSGCGTCIKDEAAIKMIIESKKR